MLVDARNQMVLLPLAFLKAVDLSNVRVKVDITRRLWVQASSAFNPSSGGLLLEMLEPLLGTFLKKFTNVLIVLTLLRKAVIT